MSTKSLDEWKRDVTFWENWISGKHINIQMAQYNLRYCRNKVKEYEKMNQIEHTQKI